MKGPEADLIERVVGVISRYNMFPPGARAGVAVSGGADSTALLHILSSLRHLWNLRLTVLHLNHLLRAEESEADEQFVRALAEEMGFPFAGERIDVAEAARQAGGNLEQTARQARKDFFARLIGAGVVDKVALGHTRSDQAETVLFRFLRGSHTTGLAGILPVTSEGLVRPLLDVTRKEVLAYLRERGIAWREDSSNSNLDFARNRIRHELLPRLTTEWNPNLTEILANHAMMAREDEEFWSAQVAEIERGILRTGPEGGVLAEVADIARLPDAMARRLIRRAIARVRGGLQGIEFQHVDSILSIVRAGDGHARAQAPGIDVLRSCDWVRFAKPLEGPAERDFEIELTVPGVARQPGNNLELCLELIEPQTRDDTLRIGLDWRRLQSRTTAEQLTLRNWRPGDAYRPAGGQREYKLKHLFQEGRVPLWERRTWPVVTAGLEIVWTRRFGPASEFVAGPSTGIVLTITERSSESTAPVFTSL